MIQDSKIWAVTCFFNPAGYRARTENYHIFRENFPLPLITVELAYDEPFALQEGDADILVQLRGGAKLWQKERLLNIGFKHLPGSCTMVVWADADVLIDDPDWPAAIEESLDESPLVHPYTLVRYFTPVGLEESTKMSTIAAWKEGRYPPRWQRGLRSEANHPLSNGYVWAARRELIDKHGLYDGCIVGGGDTACVCAAAGCPEDVVFFHQMVGNQATRYRQWAREFNKSVQGNIGVLPHSIDHLWHGTAGNRQYVNRHGRLKATGFDPTRDLQPAGNGAWDWASDNEKLHAFLEEYFRSRCEDAVPEPAVQ